MNASSPLYRAAMVLGEWLHALNPSLMESTPPFEEVTGNDVCFLGPNGETDENLITLCKDFPMRSLVGSWYLSPSRHAIEMIFFNPIFMAVLIRMLPPLSLMEKQKSTSRTSHPVGIPTLAACCMIAHITYKILGRKVLFLCVPCNMQWLLTVVLCFGNLSGQMQGVLLQFLLSFCGYTLAALATPDTSDCHYFGEAFFFYFNHVALLAVPIAYLVTGRASLLSPSSAVSHLSFNFKWWLVSCAAFGLFYFLPVSMISILSGYNVNYMMSPPPGQDIIVGDSYRLLSSGACALLIFLTRLVIVLGEIIAKATKRSRKTKKA
eukprot:scaffold3079_cov119-Cylindrotheca_fusiformis.AAC.4